MSSNGLCLLRDIEIPPRKRHGEKSESESEWDPYSSDQFRMYDFKVRRCTRSRSHDWTDCPFAHPGEKARRRDPRRHQYSGEVCPDFRRGGGCSRGESCEFAHGVFECWLHPSRYRTEPCKDGRRCSRKVCFFAHLPRQLRRLPPHQHDNLTTPSPSPSARRLRRHCWASSPPPSPLSKLVSSLEALHFVADHRLHFALSPSSSGSRRDALADFGPSNSDPDIGWVDDLLM